MTTPFPDAFILLTGGTGRRLGGVDKASIDVGGDTLFDRAVGAALGRPLVVVGPERNTKRTVTFTREDPPGGGPAAGVAAGVLAIGRLESSRLEASRLESSLLEAVAKRDRAGSELLVAVFAVDQVGVISETWQRLATAVISTAGGALLVSGGRRQYGVGVFPLASLSAAQTSRPTWHGRSLREFLDPIVEVEVDARGDESRDIDTLEDLHWWLTHADAHSGQGGAVSVVDEKGTEYDDAGEPRSEH